MKKLLCATGNNEKFGLGQTALIEYGIELVQSPVDIDEIQGEDSERIVRDKAEEAYQKLGEPVVVTDDSWAIPALGGFPGPYMKSMNHWFSPNDFINLTQSLTDKTIVIDQYLGYHDGSQIHVFHNQRGGKLLNKPKGVSGPPSQKVIAMDGDNGMSISEMYDQGIGNDPNRGANVAGVWKKLAEFLQVRT